VLVKRGGIVAAALLSFGVAGCGGSATTYPPAPEPAASPPLTVRPAGSVVHIGNMPEGLAADPRTGLVAAGLRDPAKLALINGRSGRVVRRVRLPAAPRHLQLAATGGPVLVPAEAANALVLVALPSGATTRIGVGNFPHDATASAGRLFVGDERGDKITVIDGTRVVKTLNAPVRPGGVIVSKRRLATVAVRQRVMAIYDAGSLKHLTTVDAGVGPTHVVADNDGRLYVIDTEGDALLAYRPGAHPDPLFRFNLPGRPYGVAIDRGRGIIWVTLTGTNQLVALRLQGDAPPLNEARYPTVRQPNTVAVDPLRGDVFVAGRDQGVLQILRGADQR